ncbi:MAG: arginyltransferase [Gammaproteobacteria bacterium]|nr:arginyltransferase [Gammaproteobacteria bacterium]
MNETDNRHIPFFMTPEHECSYYDDRLARTVFGDPHQQPDRRAQTELARHGFRRSGRFMYRPECHGCNACIPSRIPVAAFRPSRSQRRNLRDNADLDVSMSAPYCNDFLLSFYNRYQEHRHPEGQMLASNAAQFSDFLLSPWADTSFLEAREGNQLKAVAVFDRFEDSLSAIYTFFDPAELHRGLGVFMILQLLERARRENLDWLYLGYWLPRHPKMAYKERFRPLEILVASEWRPYDELAGKLNSRGL